MIILITFTYYIFFSPEVLISTVYCVDLIFSPLG